MLRLWLVIGFLATVFYVYSVVNVALSDRLAARGLPKAAWVVIVIVFPLIGAALWFWGGRSRGAAGRGARRVPAPDDDPEFLATLDHRKTDD